ncbi:MAG: DNA-directed RNA polymerase subunit omega [Myxococcota bacterium]
MARVTVEDCLEREENRFALVVMAARRARQLMRAPDEALVKCKNKPLVTGLREIAAGHIHFDRPSSEVVNEWVAQQQARYARRS